MFSDKYQLGFLQKVQRLEIRDKNYLEKKVQMGHWQWCYLVLKSCALTSDFDVLSLSRY